ncbi:MAG: leucyl/phenylalanyl-tRNA--protein transferase [Gammaproteobacteria bacterium]|nr:leucyl/phenylalanyl-tRNA--protein transferase [Gammaproteobacteria bacterium]
MQKKTIPWLDPESLEFPDVESAWKEPNGILAAGGDLSVERLVSAYCHGIFPWYNEDEPILWWSPEPRCVLIPSQFKLSKSLKKTIRKNIFKVTFNQCFEQVMSACAEARTKPNGDVTGTWISTEIQQAYHNLHRAGYAHSIECWKDGQLVGGLYGLAIGQVFFGESMFSRVSNASKVAFAKLCDQLVLQDFKLIDGQVYSPHLETLGFQLMPRTEFIDILNRFVDEKKLTAFE